jgi:hypothetical protein
MAKEVRSPHSRERGDFHPRLAESPGSRSSPSNARSDSGHVAPRIGKSGSQPASATRDAPTATPVVGGQRNVIEDRR